MQKNIKCLIGYTLKAIDGQIGKVVDYIIDDVTWEIKFLVVDIGTWLDSRKVLLATKWIKEVNWDNSVVAVDATTETVRGSPEFGISQMTNKANGA